MVDEEGITENPEAVEEDGRDEVQLKIDRLRQKTEASEHKQALYMGAAKRLPEIEAAEVALSEERRGHFEDIKHGAIRIIPGALEETVDLVASVSEAVSAELELGGIDVGVDDSGWPYIKTMSHEEMALNAPRGFLRTIESGWREITDLTPETERASGALVEGMGKFLAGFLTGKKALQAVSLFQGGTKTAQAVNAFTAGALADAAVFDGHEGRLSDLLITFDNPIFNNAVTQYLATDEEDSELESRMKTILEGAMLGIFAEGFMVSLKYIYKNRKGVQRAKDYDEADLIETPLSQSDDVLEESHMPVDLDSANNTTDGYFGDLNPEGPNPSDEVDFDELIGEPARESHAVRDQQERKLLQDANTRKTVSLSSEQIAAFKKAMEADDEEAVGAVLKDFNESKINWGAMEDGESIKRVMQITEDQFASIIDKAKGGVQTNKQTRILANLVNATGAEVNRLFRDVRDGNGFAARFYSAQRVMLASAKEVQRLGKIVKRLQDEGIMSPKDEAAFLHQMNLHAAIQAEVKGTQTELSRAVQSMGMIKSEMAESFKEFGALKATLGTKTHTSKAFASFVDDMLEEGMGLGRLNEKARHSSSQRGMDIFAEYVINAMLSNPKTHIINVVSNALNTFMYTMDRTVSGLYLGARGDRAALREAKLDMTHKLTSLGGAFKLARQAWKEGAPIADKRQRIEVVNRRSIASDHEGLWGRAVNWLGEMVRIPGHALIAGDEFFKHINRTAEMHVLSFRTADDEAIKLGYKYGSKKYETYITKRTIDLLDPKGTTQIHKQIRSESTDKARMATFQETAQTIAGDPMQKFVGMHPMFKLVVAPFFKTGSNILRQGILDRSPLGLVMKKHRDSIAAGGREGAETVARMTSSIAAFSVFFPLMGEDGYFEVVGKIPYDSSRKLAGIKDYSFRWGDTWYQFSRLDPLGMWLGLMADFKTHSEYAAPGEETDGAFAFAQAASVAFMNNVGDRHWSTSLFELVDLASAAGKGDEKAFDRFMSSQTGKLIPGIVKSVGKATVVAATGEQDEAVVAWEFMDQLSAQLPLLNRTLPPKHDALGRVISSDSGLLAIINPFATSPHPTDPLDIEMARLAFTIKPMAKTLGGGAVDLTNDEYSRLTGLVAKTGVVEAMSALVTSDGWEDISDPMKEAQLKKLIRKGRTSARVMILQDESVRTRISDADRSAVMLLLGVDE